MFALLAPFMGFFSAFLPDLIKYFQAKQEFAHDERMRQLDIEAQKFVATVQLDQTIAKGDIDDAVSARSMTPSYGTKLLDAVAGEQGWFLRFIKGALILALALIEVLNGLMRPTVVYYVMGLWGGVKAARFYLYLSASGSHDWATIAAATAAIWDDEDKLIVEYVVGFLFGIRHRLKTVPA